MILFKHSTQVYGYRSLERVVSTLDLVCEHLVADQLSSEISQAAFPVYMGESESTIEENLCDGVTTSLRDDQHAFC